MSEPVEKLLRIMRQLRDEREGCAWDRRQSFASIAPSTLEEAYEVVDAIHRGNFDDLKDELGDLLFQVVFHAQMASEQNRFDFGDVAAAIGDKLIRRHPHVFANGRKVDADQQSVEWENIKAQERATGMGGEAADASHLAGVPRALPALTRAIKLSKRAARVGFDWDKPTQTAEKVAEELEEVLQAIRADEEGLGSAGVFEEVGDLLFAAANLARKLNVDAESALRAANSKFERRFRHMEAVVRERGEIFERLPLATLEELWIAAKRAELNDS